MEKVLGFGILAFNKLGLKQPITPKKVVGGIFILGKSKLGGTDVLGGNTKRL